MQKEKNCSSCLGSWSEQAHVEKASIRTWSCGCSAPFTDRCRSHRCGGFIVLVVFLSRRSLAAGVSNVQPAGFTVIWHAPLQEALHLLIQSWNGPVSSLKTFTVSARLENTLLSLVSITWRVWAGKRKIRSQSRDWVLPSLYPLYCNSRLSKPEVCCLFTSLTQALFH